MSKHGQYSFVIGKEIDRSINFAKNIAMGMYSGKYCKKPQRKGMEQQVVALRKGREE